jgi:ribonucleoside-triphosphate reductase
MGINWGSTGEVVYERTYSRTKPDGTKETWPETVDRVVSGNLALVDSRYQLRGEREELIRLMTEFKILPGGRHLWASGVKNAAHLFNCWVAGWTDNPSDHFAFTFMRLMEGGGVGSNYSNKFLEQYPPVQQELWVHIVCDEEHPDYEAMKAAGVLSEVYDPEWMGAYVIEDSREGWAAALTDLIDTAYRDEVSHYNRVYDVSRIRPAGAKLKTFGGRASGPLPFSKMLIQVCNILGDVTFNSEGKLTGLDAMEIDHSIAQCVVAGGVRRAARMAMMHWADPQIMEFIHCKEQSGSHWTTNISVEVDSEFWHQTRQGHAWTAAKVLNELGVGAVRNGEPGMWDSSLSNVGEPNRVICTNPCGEITLEAWEPCNLGHVNLQGFVEKGRWVNYVDLHLAHRLMTRFLIRATFAEVGDPRSREVLDRNRRIGLGHLGTAGFLALNGIRYSDAPQNGWFVELLDTLADLVDEEAARFSHDLRIPVPVKKRTVAPTGTIAKMPGVSEGIHPIFSRFFNRRIRFTMTDPEQADTVDRYQQQGYWVEPDLVAANTMVVTIPTKDSLVQAVEDSLGPAYTHVVESADELTLDQMLAMQACYQQNWADNSVSFTANVDPDRYLPGDIADTLQAFAGKIKGSTVFPELSFKQAPYERITEAEWKAATGHTISDGVNEECTSGACPIR